MKTLRFYGASDDLFEFESYQDDVLIASEETSPPYKKPGAYLLANLEHEMLVTAFYEHDLKTPCWILGVTLVDEGASLPDWPVRFYYDESIANDYSPILEIDVPDDVNVTEWSND